MGEKKETLSKDDTVQDRSDIRDNEGGMEENIQPDPSPSSAVNQRGTEREAINIATQSSRRRRQSNTSETSQRDELLAKKSIQKRKHYIWKEILFFSILGAVLLVYVCLYLHY